MNGSGSRKEFVVEFSWKTWFEIATVALGKGFSQRIAEFIIVITVEERASDIHKVFWT